MQTFPETPGYLPQGADSLYFVHHHAVGPSRAAVLLVGPMALERTHGYVVWARWARHLAQRGVEVLRFDYRGVGESTGRFEQMTLARWEEDVRAALGHLRASCPGVPVVVHGLRLGALLGARVFADEGLAGLLMWDPPESGRAHLMDLLRRKVASDNLEGTGGPRRSREDYVAELESGMLMEVEGYPWSRELWRSTESYGLALPTRDDARPWRVVHLDGRPAEKCLVPGRSLSARIPRPFFWTASNKLLPDMSQVFEDGLTFIAEASARTQAQEAVS
ncbi:hypothetical protein DRW03_31745 [Corallococcus sp. H22C18031201]|uniref:serine aminopeptidase domain-containing protein n=1 Tax=Citreicoccus inhibens TaxID=2849499 RepID=UPI000E76DBCF|nr:alpha/beta hydrolase [Citreicoccus inhibens]MBU8898694.1 alpha/beta hydrolase [Citreicoccus inhibens]RJS15942.1 hypothetical protein DRW03_31745 [Corallococcus sp. H22C18031201]